MHKKSNPNSLELKLIPFNSSHTQYFAALNMEWIRSYFEVEPNDEAVLNEPITNIIEKGGHIIMAVLEGVYVGTVAMIPENEKVIELAKMGVSPKYQGRGIGAKLIAAVIDFAREKDYKSVILYSNTVLKPAIHLYKKFGFKEVELEDYSAYKRTNIKMRLDL